MATYRQLTKGARVRDRYLPMRAKRGRAPMRNERVHTLNSSQGGPFRSYGGALDALRTGIRFMRLQKAYQRSRLRGPKQFIIGEEVSLGPSADIRSPHLFEAGHHVSIGKNFTTEADVRIGNHVLISSNVSLLGNHHPFDDPNFTIYDAPRYQEDFIEIGSDVFIGFGATIVGSVRIGDGCVVGAGSVVVKDLPERMVCAGVPAKPIRDRYRDGTMTD